MLNCVLIELMCCHLLNLKFLLSFYYHGKVVRWCADSDFLRHFCILYFHRVACSTFQTCILNLHQGYTMCGSTVDIQSATAENRRGKKR